MEELDESWPAPSLLTYIHACTVSQHFKECVMVHILPNIIQVIMLATSSDAFLDANSSYPFGHITIWLNQCPEKLA
jgi:hypothetical protein